MEHTVTETVKVWGVRTEFPEHKLGKFLDEVECVYYNIPTEHRASAEIDFEPYFDCAGESYPQVRITYERPESQEEANSRADEDRKRWMEQLEQARERVTYCEAQLNDLPVKRRT